MNKQLILTGCVLSLALPLRAQGEGTPPIEPKSAAADSESPEPRLARATIGPEAIVRDASGAKLGTVEDHVLDTRDGARIQFVVVRLAEDSDVLNAVLVPYEEFRWNAKHGSLQLEMGKDALADREPFDPAAFESPKVDEEAEGEELPAQEPRSQHLASSILQATILADGQAYGRIAELVFEPKNGSVPLVLVKAEGGIETSAEPLIVPWRALEADADEEGAFAVALAKRHLASAPRLERGDLRTLEVERLRNVFEFWGIEVPSRLRTAS